MHINLLRNKDQYQQITPAMRYLTGVKKSYNGQNNNKLKHKIRYKSLLLTSRSAVETHVLQTCIACNLTHHLYKTMHKINQRCIAPPTRHTIPNQYHNNTQYRECTEPEYQYAKPTPVAACLHCTNYQHGFRYGACTKIMNLVRNMTKKKDLTFLKIEMSKHP